MQQMIYRSKNTRHIFHTKRLSLVALFCLLMVGFFSCNRLPDHARYIPKDAIVVAGINLESLSKKIAWNVITGSKLFKEMQQRLPQKNANDAVNNIEKSGIDFINTIYFYVKTDKRLDNGNRLYALVPIADAAAFETYIRNIIPGVDIKTHGDRKEALIGGSMFLSWNQKLLIVTNALGGNNYMDMLSGEAHSGKKPAATDVENSAEMDLAFNTSGENSIVGNKHFKKLATDGNDLMLWVNYDLLFSQYMAEQVNDKMGGLGINNTLWKDAAVAAGFNFKSGKISGDILYYVSDDLQDIGKDLGSVNADEDMTRRLPLQNMNLVMAWHLSPSGIRKSVEKTGLLGLVNLGLGTQGLSFDQVLSSFSGDMAVAVNNLSLKTVIAEDDLMGQTVKHATQKPNLDLTFVIKINDKVNFKKIFGLYAETAGLNQGNNGCYSFPIDRKDSVYIMLDDKFMVASNKKENTENYLSGKYKNQAAPKLVDKYVIGYPLGIAIDIHEIVKNIDPGVVGSAHDSLVFAESKILLSNVVVNGGTFKNSAFSSHIDINFTNSDENSIIALMDYGMKITDVEKITENK